MSELIDNVPLREEVLKYVTREGISWASCARRAGFKTTRGEQEMRRKLGITKSVSPSKTYYQRRINYGLATRICKGLNIDPIDVGL